MKNFVALTNAEMTSISGGMGSQEVTTSPAPGGGNYGGGGSIGQGYATKTPTITVPSVTQLLTQQPLGKH